MGEEKHTNFRLLLVNNILEDKKKEGSVSDWENKNEYDEDEDEMGGDMEWKR
jgi:hypothetical protein